MKKSIIKSLVLLLLVSCSFNTFAQADKSSKKVVIITKIKDKNGKETVKRVEKQGAEADAYIQELQLRQGEDEDIDIDVDITIDGATEKKKKVRVIEIEDINELSEEMKKELKDLDVDIKILEDSDGKQVEIKQIRKSNWQAKAEDNVERVDINKEGEETVLDIKMKDGVAKTFKWKGDKMPDNIREELEAMGANVGEESHREERIITRKRMGLNSDKIRNQAFLGVLLGKSTDLGVTVSEVIKGSAAEKAGLQKGDVVTAVEDEKVKTSNELIGALAGKKAGDEVEISYIRGDATAKTKATLEANKVMNNDHKMIWISDDEVETIDFEEKNTLFIGDDNENVKNINVNKNGDETEISIEDKEGKVTEYKWKGKMPEDIRKKLEAAGINVIVLEK